MNKLGSKPELLAPAGGAENFFAAIEAGADAVYMGLPGVNARNLAKEPRLAEIGAMIGYAHAQGKKFYLAANSLILQKEIKDLLRLLALVTELTPDALIVQDLGLLRLVREHFPSLNCHASTLMTTHSAASVQMFARLGCKRVVLARELTVVQIAAICQRAPVEIEVFIHGAMCFAYSGLCLFSSYLGGKSGLRGQCVQPCRRAYRIGAGTSVSQKNKGGYLFSMNDLNGLPAINGLRQAGVTSLKIEGRQRSAHYVATVTAAYRQLLDATPERLEEAMGEARELLAQAMTRKTGDGYFFSPRPDKAISPWHSGNLGRYLGRIYAEKSNTSSDLPPLRLTAALAVGDRLRLHPEPSGERLAFTVKTLRLAGREVSAGKVGDEVTIHPPKAPEGGWRSIDCYLVDIRQEKKPLPALALPAIEKKLHAAETAKSTWIQNLARRLLPAPEEDVEKTSPKTLKGKRSAAHTAPLLPWWLRIDTAEILKQPLPQPPEAIVFDVGPRMMRQARNLTRRFGSEQLIAALPPVIFDGERQHYEEMLKELRRLGLFRLQLGHIGQLAQFDLGHWRLAADYTFNLMNALALGQAAALGITSLQLAIELDKNALRQAIQALKRGPNLRNIRLGLTVYGWPALFTARLSAPFFAVEKPMISPKNEAFRHRQSQSGSQILPLRPFSLIPHLPELALAGLDYCLADLRSAAHPRKDIEEFIQRLGQRKNFGRLSSFNYAGTLV
ncbi:MAG: U32 family peptidase [Desulfobulbaceae bacterium]|nr:U32 family peptidase [Desulfobulbaceae bacterium]